MSLTPKKSIAPAALQQTFDILKNQGYPYLAIDLDINNACISYWDDRMENEVKIFFFDSENPNSHLTLERQDSGVTAVLNSRGDIYTIDVASLKSEAFIKVNFRSKRINRYI